jgi:L-fucose mutarotase
MLKNIPYSFTPDLLRLMMAMGHGEELLIGDGNFPALTTNNCEIKRIYLPIQDIASLLGDILRFFPLDETTDAPLVVMESARESGAYEQYRQTVDRMGTNTPIRTLERFAFYQRAALAAGMVITASILKGGNIILKKGVVRDDS